MPASVSWPRYLRMFGASVLSMFAGTDVIHQYYRPDLTIPETWRVEDRTAGQRRGCCC
ncbi:ubiquinol-cytochrome-c reductase complex assembly factor 6-like [Oncorhynchus clarkii lewisi]|uniref:ubiquinol-cytochrome-c reductase complex assembly factor 6-like n=1 Tax=Oncorhynchus clarkii lewisi TaxID=490388 RepID=UPI0039B96C20